MNDDSRRVDYRLVKAITAVAAMIATGATFVIVFVAALRYEWIGMDAGAVGGAISWIAIFSVVTAVMLWLVDKTAYEEEDPPTPPADGRKVPLHRRNETTLIDVGERGGGGE